MRYYRQILLHLLILGGVTFIFFHREQQLRSELIHEEGARVLAEWARVYDAYEVERLSAVNYSRLYGYFFGGVNKSNINDPQFNFEAADLMLPVTSTYIQNFTVEVLGRDFNRVWEYVKAVKEGNIQDTTLTIEKWDYIPKSQPAVSITFFRERNNHWRIWVSGYTPLVPVMTPVPQEKSTFARVFDTLMDHRTAATVN